MGMIGGAVLTPLMGWISMATQSVALAYLIPMAGYICVALYAYFGSTQKPRKSTPMW
jgi:FHS family L-fucose permease-like MFS transporter